MYTFIQDGEGLAIKIQCVTNTFVLVRLWGKKPAAQAAGTDPS